MRGLMTIHFNHERLDAYQESVRFVAWWAEQRPLIADRAHAIDHLDRAGASMPTNIAQGNAKQGMDARNSRFDSAYGSALECAACLDVLAEKSIVEEACRIRGKRQLRRIVGMVIGLRKSPENPGRVRERPTIYGHDDEDENSRFDHETLRVYGAGMRYVGWCHDFSSCAHELPAATARLWDKTSTAIVLHVAEGNGKFSTKDRCRFIEYARVAAFQAAPVLDVTAARHPALTAEIERGKSELSRIVSMLYAWERSLRASEDEAENR